MPIDPRIDDYAPDDYVPETCDVCGAELGGYVEIEDPATGETAYVCIRCAGMDADPDECQDSGDCEPF